LPATLYTHETSLRVHCACAMSRCCVIARYVKGCGLEPYGFLPAERIVGLSFSQAALVIAKENLLLLAAQVGCCVCVCCGRLSTEGG